MSKYIVVSLHQFPQLLWNHYISSDTDFSGFVVQQTTNNNVNRYTMFIQPIDMYIGTWNGQVQVLKKMKFFRKNAEFYAHKITVFTWFVIILIHAGRGDLWIHLSNYKWHNGFFLFVSLLTFVSVLHCAYSSDGKLSLLVYKCQVQFNHFYYLIS